MAVTGLPMCNANLWIPQVNISQKNYKKLKVA